MGSGNRGRLLVIAVAVILVAGTWMATRDDRIVAPMRRSSPSASTEPSSRPASPESVDPGSPSRAPSVPDVPSAQDAPIPEDAGPYPFEIPPADWSPAAKQTLAALQKMTRLDPGEISRHLPATLALLTSRLGVPIAVDPEIPEQFLD